MIKLFRKEVNFFYITLCFTCMIQLYRDKVGKETRREYRGPPRGFGEHGHLLVGNKGTKGK